MSENRLNLTELQDEYLDTLLRLAFRHEAAMEAQSAQSADGAPLTAAEEASLQSTLDAAWKKIDAKKRRQRREWLRAGFRRILPKVLEAAACVVLVLAIAVPIAVANVSSFRSQVMQLLIGIDQARGVADIRIAPNGEQFDVPADWDGKFYPSYIPAGMQLIEVDCFESCCAAEYANGTGQRLIFHEYAKDATASIGTEFANISVEMINGQEAWIAESEELKTVYMTWSMDGYFLFLRSDGLGRVETMRAAESVKKISP